MNISCCAWALSGPEEGALDQLAAIGFRHIDVQARTYTSAQSRSHQSDLGLKMSCVGLSFNMEIGAAMDSPDASARQKALDHIEAGLDQTASYGVDTAYVVPGDNDALLPHFTESLIAANELAAARQIKLCVEHFPGKALPTARGTLAFLRDLKQDNLYLLLDSGHLQISDEDPAEIIAEAGLQLGYAHLDDNDGEGDLHWSLCDGIMTRDALQATLTALEVSPYSGPVSLELHPELADPAASLKRSFDLVRELLDQ